MARPRSFVLAAVAGAVAATLVGGIAWAAIPSGGVYTACMLKNVGTVRLIDKSLPPNNLMGHCKPTLETEVSWSQQGAQGIQGVPGTNGTNGTNGIDGDDGAPGGTTTSFGSGPRLARPTRDQRAVNPGEVVSRNRKLRRPERPGHRRRDLVDPVDVWVRCSRFFCGECSSH